MHTPRSILTALVAALLLATAAPGAAAQSPGYEEKEDKFVLQNDHVTVWFQGKKPMLHVFPTGENATDAGYGYAFASVVEFRDLDGDGAPAPEEVVGRLNLRKASEFQVEHIATEGEVVLNLTLVDEVRVAGAGPLEDANLTIPADREAEVTLVFTLRDAPVTLTVDNVSVEVPQTSIKYDFLVTRWPWVDAENHLLALEMEVTGAVEADLDGEVAAATVDANGTEVGALSWTTTAQATTPEGENLTVPVEAVVDSQENATRVTFVYDAPGFATLLHDPTIGVASSETLDEEEAAGLADGIKDVPAPAALAVLGALGLGAAARRRSR